jgi:hypothetical protein
MIQHPLNIILEIGRLTQKNAKNWVGIDFKKIRELGGK